MGHLGGNRPGIPREGRRRSPGPPGLPRNARQVLTGRLAFAGALTFGLGAGRLATATDNATNAAGRLAYPQGAESPEAFHARHTGEPLVPWPGYRLEAAAAALAGRSRNVGGGQAG
jgi:hypothetical protein